jgi:hypothetical protein
MKKCINCFTYLRQEKGRIAKRCYQCHAWQNYRKWLEVLITPLTLLIAIITIYFSLLVPISNEVFEKKSNVEFSLLSSSPDEIKILIGNSGNISAGVTEVYLYLSKVNHTYPINQEQLGALSETGSSHIISIRAKELMLPVIANKQHVIYSGGGVTKCELVVVYVDIGSDRVKEERRSYECYLASYTLNNYEFKKYQ